MLLGRRGIIVLLSHDMGGPTSYLLALALPSSISGFHFPKLSSQSFISRTESKVQETKKNLNIIRILWVHSSVDAIVHVQYSSL